MGNVYQRNEKCIVGLPRCDYAFGSSRSCFIAYGFKESKLETDIIKDILIVNNMEAFEAGGEVDPGKYAFCTKICSKIITSQFCAVLLNLDEEDGAKKPNANVNMEYGLMLGFGKYVVPFQREKDPLPFNVSGLDTIKYDSSSFRDRAEIALKKAIEQTKPSINEFPAVDRILLNLSKSRDVLWCPIEDAGNKSIYDLGYPFGYYLLTDYSGLEYIYLGVFNLNSIESIMWRIAKLETVIKARFSVEAIRKRIGLGMLSENQAEILLELRQNMSAWIVVQTSEVKSALAEFVSGKEMRYEIMTVSEIAEEGDVVESI